MLRRLAPADELAEIRAEIARLQARAAQVEALLVRSPHLRQRGTWHMAEVRETIVPTFDATLLPAAIRDDPHYRRDVVQREVALLPIRARPVPLRPGWPIRRNPDGSVAMPLPSH
jgi:hypothetical protein